MFLDSTGNLVRHVFSHNWADCLPERPQGRCLVGWRLPIRPMWQISNSPPVRRPPVGFGRRQPSTQSRSASSWRDRCGELDIGRKFHPAPNRPSRGTASRLSQRLQPHAQQQGRRHRAGSRRSMPGRSIRAADYKATITVARLPRTITRHCCRCAAGVRHIASSKMGKR